MQSKAYKRRWMAKYRKNNREKYLSYIRLYRQRRYSNEPWLRTFEGIRCRLRQARRLRYKQLRYIGIKMLMTRDDLKNLWIRDNAALMENPSIDRIDPNGDYSVDNCRYVEMIENRRLVKKRNILTK